MDFFCFSRDTMNDQPIRTQWNYRNSHVLSLHQLFAAFTLMQTILCLYLQLLNKCRGLLQPALVELPDSVLCWRSLLWVPQSQVGKTFCPKYTRQQLSATWRPRFTFETLASQNTIRYILKSINVLRFKNKSLSLFEALISRVSGGVEKPSTNAFTVKYSHS